MHHQPFIYGKAVKGEFFTDREKETKWLKWFFPFNRKMYFLVAIFVGKV